MLWLQGLENAPELVHRCLRSWARHNPGWKIVLLHQHNIKEFVDVDEFIGRNRPVISLQALSNVIRINLLAQHGGLWVDSTCYCCRPLDEWLGRYTTSGFFAFANPARDRLISSWFLASRPGCPLTAAYRTEVNRYWSRNVFAFQNRRRGRQLVRWTDKLLDRNSRSAGLWVHPLVAKTLKVHPYHWFHYIFYRVVTGNDSCRQIWTRTPKMGAAIPQRLRRAGLLRPLSPDLRAIIDNRTDPLYKLDWRHEKKDWAPGSVLDYLMQPPSATP